MAQATAISFSKFRVKLGNAASPEVFTAPCGFNSRSFRRTKNTNEVDLPDCTDEDLPAYVGREVRSLDWSISGEGILSEEAVSTWETWYASTASKNIKVELVFLGSPGTITLTGAAHLTSYEVSGTRGDKVQISVEILGDGVLTSS
jgi:hypothetical protein